MAAKSWLSHAALKNLYRAVTSKAKQFELRSLHRDLQLSGRHASEESWDKTVMTGMVGSVVELQDVAKRDIFTRAERKGAEFGTGIKGAGEAECRTSNKCEKCGQCHMQIQSLIESRHISGQKLS